MSIWVLKPFNFGHCFKSSDCKNHDICCCSFAQLCPSLCNPMDCRKPGLPVLHHLLELTQTCPLSQWCHPTISSSVIPFSSCLQSFPASGYFPMSQFFASGGQSTGVSASASFLPKNTQDWSPLEWTGWICIRELPWIFLSLIMRLCHWDGLIA